MMGGSEASEYTEAGQFNDLGLRRWWMLGGSAYRRILPHRIDAQFETESSSASGLSLVVDRLNTSRESSMIPGRTDSENGQNEI
jgi:hypothetical protein